ncbi:iron uptake porin [Synechococcus sp. UW140]|uniref:iron uptake porin n=1 Tax=Synechococcus sp. UW140 TaxID=368503 RepID=UPI000E0F734D|nr:iron uptake porin [Synechococcus sp. UW140]
MLRRLSLGLAAPAALGLLAPVAANASDLNINGVSDYAASGEQVTSITQFSDVVPTDWAYQALSNLIERYGCVAGYPNGTYRGNRAMTRFEAAALLNTCLDRITEVTDELKRLMKEFERELAILKGRVDGLEARVGELEATQFSTTTKLRGQTTFVIGANSYGGDAQQGRDYFEIQKNNMGQYDVIGGFGTRRSKVASELSGATTFNYDIRLFVDTSFTGKDLLRTMLRAGNFQNTPFYASRIGAGGYVGLSALAVTFGEPKIPDSLSVNRLFYQFPVGRNLQVTAGPIVRQDEMLAIWPGAYSRESVLNFFSYAGAPAVYDKTLGAGGGISWTSNEFSVSANYVSCNGQFSSPNKGKYGARQLEGGTPFNPAGGIGTDAACSNGTVQIAYAPDNWGLAAAYTYSSGINGAGIYSGSATNFAAQISQIGNANSFGLSAWWSPLKSAWYPSISAGWGYSKMNSEGIYKELATSAVYQSWSIGLEWDDAFLIGNTLGMAVGQPTFVTSWDNTSKSGNRYTNNGNYINDGNYAWEGWYKFQISDYISVTPAIYYLSRPLGAVTNAKLNTGDGAFNNFGAILKSTFKF